MVSESDLMYGLMLLLCIWAGSARILHMGSAHTHTLSVPTWGVRCESEQLMAALQHVRSFGTILVWGAFLSSFQLSTSDLMGHLLSRVILTKMHAQGILKHHINITVNPISLI